MAKRLEQLWKRALFVLGMAALVFGQRQLGRGQGSGSGTSGALCGTLDFVVYGDGVFVGPVIPAYSPNVTVWTSFDGISWNLTFDQHVQYSGASNPAYGNGRFILGFEGGPCLILNSEDGTGWKVMQATTSKDFGCPGLIYFQESQSQFVAFGDGGIPATSFDGIEWNDVPNFPFGGQVYGQLGFPNPFSDTWLVPVQESNNQIYIFDSTLQTIISSGPADGLILNRPVPVGYNSWIFLNENYTLSLVNIVGDTITMGPLSNLVVTQDSSFFTVGQSQIVFVNGYPTADLNSVYYANLNDLAQWYPVQMPSVIYPVSFQFVPAVINEEDHWYFFGSGYDAAVAMVSKDLIHWDVLYNVPCTK